MDTNKSLLELADDYKAASNITAADIFKKPNPSKVENPVEENKDLYDDGIISEEEKTVENDNTSTNLSMPEPISIADKIKTIKEAEGKKKKAWTPDSSLTEDMPELKNLGVVYDKKDVVLNKDGKLVNIIDDKLVEQGTNKVAELVRVNQNIEIAKERKKIKYFHIPPQGPLQMEMILAASDPDVKSAQDALDACIDRIAYNHPEMIEFIKDNETATYNSNSESTDHTNTSIDDEPEKKTETISFTEDSEDEESEDVPDDNTITLEEVEIPEPEIKEDIKPESTETKEDTTLTPIKKPSLDEVNINIDKIKLPNLTWRPEDIEKVRKSRVVNLNIIEKNDIEFGTIRNADDKLVDLVTQNYYRKNNDIEAPLPASHYRATFSGLSYTEVLDLRTSQEINPIDSEKVKWGICFGHIHNQSIGPWEEYVLYRDPATQEEFRVSVMSDVPKNIPSKNVHRVTKEEDFLRKTSFVDLEFILWKILCATSMSQEIIQFTCSNKINGATCNNVYDWIYSPSALLDESTINPAVLEEIAKTGKVMSKEDILKNYNDSLLCAQNYVRLPSSKFVMLYGHASAYEYIYDIYPLVRSLSDSENINNPLSISKMLAYLALGCIREILIPDNKNGGYIRVKSANNIIKILNTFDEFDWQTINEIAAMIINPYHFTYVLKDVICPKCGHKENVELDSVSRLLFILAQSLESVSVHLTRK